ncbi:hypothetical protein LCGC14_2363440, partial [marine sediment metagenome]
TIKYRHAEGVDHVNNQAAQLAQHNDHLDRLLKMLDDEGGHEFMIGPPAPIDITEGERLARAFAADLAAGWDLEPDDYLAHLAKVVRDADPYDRIITTNYARPRAKWCEIVTFHEYMGMPAAGVDAYLAKEIGKFKAYGKVVQNTEFGNQGWLSNYDPIKWRIAVWTAFMNESGILFWGMSGGKTTGRRPYRGNANAYIGPESRQYFRVLNAFTRDMPIDMRPVASGYTEHNDLRIYALSNGAVSALYVHHFSDHKKAYQLPDPLFVQTGPGSFRVRWIDPADGKTVRTNRASTKGQYLSLKLPPVKIDLACRIDRAK